MQNFTREQADAIVHYLYSIHCYLSITFVLNPIQWRLSKFFHYEKKYVLRFALQLFFIDFAFGLMRDKPVEMEFFEGPINITVNEKGQTE